MPVPDSVVKRDHGDSLAGARREVTAPTGWTRKPLVLGTRKPAIHAKIGGLPCRRARAGAGARRGAALRPSASCDAAPRTSALPPTYRRSTTVVRLCTFEIKEAEDLIKHHEAGPA